MLNARGHWIEDFPIAWNAKLELKKLHVNKEEIFQEISRAVENIGKATNAHFNAAGEQKAKKDYFNGVSTDRAIIFTKQIQTLLWFKNVTMALEPIEKKRKWLTWTETDRTCKLELKQWPWEWKENIIQDLSTNEGTRPSELMITQPKSFEKMLKQQKRHT